MALEEYRRKRDFTATPEPTGSSSRAPGPVTGSSGGWDDLPHGRRFCVQMHRATRLHFDFRLEHDGVLLSWAVPRGPSLDPAAKRLAVHVEDHPVDYGDFEGVIPSGYGAGTVLLWDIGTYQWARESREDHERQILKGDIKFQLTGNKLNGEFALVHIGGRRPGDDPKAWLILKKRDQHVVPGFEARDLDSSVKSGRTLTQIAAEGGGDPRGQKDFRPEEGGRGAASPAGTTAVGRLWRPPLALAGGASPAARGSPSGDAAPLPPSPSEVPPPSLRPMKASPIEHPFSREGWLYEMKYDGVRALITVSHGAVRVTGRNGRDETGRYPEAQRIAGRLRAREALLDGEIVVFDEQGRSSFQRLQPRINLTRPADVARAAASEPVQFVLFDLLALDGRDLTGTALRIRKQALHDILDPAPDVVFAEHVETEGETFFAALSSMGGEGMVAKRGDSLYHPGRAGLDWLKVKAWLTQSCVVCGFTAGRATRGRLGALILGVRDGDAFVHCGQVGTGFDERALSALAGRLSAIVVDRSPLRTTPATSEPATWVAPELVCEVRHAGWTASGALRHPSYLGLRSDVRPEECVREPAIPTELALTGAIVSERAAGALPTSDGPTSGGPDSALVPLDLPPDASMAAALEELRHLRPTDNWSVAGRVVHLTNLDKVLWPDDGITKRDMVAHYVRVAPHLLPYLRNRPLSMQVFPDGIRGKSFWRKDKPGHAPDWIESWTYHGEKTKEYILVNEVATLAWVANAGVVDLHPWHSRYDAPDRPDWAVFDLDPFEPATFADVVDIARLVKAALDHYGMRAVAKTSGQTGLQIYVPLRRGPDYTAVRGWVERVGRAIGRIEPDRITWEWSVARRDGRIRIDYTQNIINKTLAAPYSLRPAPGAPVSTPIRWEELDDPELRPDRWTIATIGERLASAGDLFTTALDGDQDLPDSP